MKKTYGPASQAFGSDPLSANLYGEKTTQTNAGEASHFTSFYTLLAKQLLRTVLTVLRNGGGSAQ